MRSSSPPVWVCSCHQPGDEVQGDGARGSQFRWPADPHGANDSHMTRGGSRLLLGFSWGKPKKPISVCTQLTVKKKRGRPRPPRLPAPPPDLAPPQQPPPPSPVASAAHKVLGPPVRLHRWHGGSSKFGFGLGGGPVGFLPRRVFRMPLAGDAAGPLPAGVIVASRWGSSKVPEPAGGSPERRASATLSRRET